MVWWMREHPPDLEESDEGANQSLQLDRHLLDLAGELERYVVGEIDRRTGILADVQGLIEGYADRNRPLHSPLGNFVFINADRRGSALTDAAAVVGKNHLHGVL